MGTDLRVDDRSVDRRYGVALVLIVLMGALLRGYGITFGLPYLYDQDEPLFVYRAIRILADRDLNPHWFGVPATTTIYLLTGLYGAVYGVGYGLGLFSGPEDFKALYNQDPTVFYLGGRIISAVFGVAAIVLTYMIGRRLFNRMTGLLAAALLALSPLHVMYSKHIRPDLQMSFLTLLVFWFCLDILRCQAWSRSVFSGFFTGVAAATKYPGVVVASVVMLAHALSRPWHPRLLAMLLVAGAASVAGVIVASPFLFFNFQTVLADVAREATPVHLSATGEGLVANLVWYVRLPLVETLSVTGLVLAALGIVLAVTSSRRREGWLLVTFPVAFAIFIASLHLRWHRWIIPVIPFLCLLAAQALYRTAVWIGARWSLRLGVVVGGVLLTSVVVPLFISDLIQGREMSGTDTRTLAREWMMKHVPAGSRVLLETYTPEFSVDRYRMFLVDGEGRLAAVKVKTPVAGALFQPDGTVGSLRDHDAIHQERIEYMVISDWYERFRAERERYSDIVASYEELMGMGTLVYEARRTPGVNGGPTIRVYRFAAGEG